eukprot:COSAG02_NODE_1818_length_10774_cov_4.788009_1_plen_1151_part_00
MGQAMFVRRTELLPILEFQRDFRLAGRDFRPGPTTARLEPEPELELLQAGRSVEMGALQKELAGKPRSCETGGLQPVPCRTFLRAGLCGDRRLPGSPAREEAVRLCSLVQERARSFGYELRAPTAAVAVAQNRAGTQNVEVVLQQLSGDELLQLDLDGQAWPNRCRAPDPQGKRLAALVQTAREARELAQVRLVVGDGGNCGIVLGDGVPLAGPAGPDCVTPASVTVLGFDPGVDPPAGVRAGMILTEVDGRTVYGWTSAALESLIQLAEADQRPLALTFSRASSWMPAWQDLRAGAAILLQAAARCRAATNNFDHIRVQKVERQQAQLKMAIVRVQSMHRGRMSRRVVSVSQTRSLVVTLQRLYRFKVRQRELGEWATQVLQTCARAFLARCTYKHKREAAVAIQSTRRALPVRNGFRRQRLAACQIQSRARGQSTRQKIAQWRKAAVYIERCQRGHVARLAVQWMRERLRLLSIAATVCQTKVRGSSARRSLRRLKSATMKLQALLRGRTARQHLAEQHAAAVSIQKQQRMLKVVRIWRAQRTAVRTMQSFVRGWSTRRALAEELRQIRLAKVLWAEIDENDVKEMVKSPTRENLERMIEFNNKFEGQLLALRSAAALNPTSLTSPRGIATEKPEFDVTFSEPGSLGVRFAPHKRTGDMELTAIKPGTQAQQHRNLRPGLVLVGVAGVDVAGKAPREVVDMLKRGGRPLKLTFLRTTPNTPTDCAAVGTIDTLSGLMAGKQKTNVLTTIVNAQAAEEHLTGGYTFHPQTSYTHHLLKHGKRGHEAPFHRRRAEGVVRQILQMQHGDLVTDKDVDLAANTVLTLPNDKPRLRSIKRLRGQKKLMMAVNAMQARDFEVRNCYANAVQNYEPEFDVTFSEPGSLGVRFAPHKRTGDMELTAIKPGTQAQQHRNLRPGLVLVGVAGVDVAGKAPREVVDMLKRGGRPLKLSFLCPGLKRPAATEAPKDDESSSIERLRQKENSSKPLPPSAPTVRVPMTPQKLTESRRSPSFLASPRLRLSPANGTTAGCSEKGAWVRTTTSTPDESWAKLQETEAAAARKLAHRISISGRPKGIEVTSKVDHGKLRKATASTKAIAKAGPKTVPRQQLNRHALAQPATRAKAVHLHTEKEPSAVASQQQIVPPPKKDREPP